jgi:hypothetical protein
MAQLPGNNVKFSDMRNLKTGSGQANLRGLEQNYMGSGGTWVKAAGVCMPNDIINVNDATLNLGTSARTVDGVWSYSAGPYTGSSTWGPHGAKEFKEAYNGIPGVALTKTNTGANGCAFKLNITISGEFMPSIPSRYTYQVNGGAWTTAPSQAFTLDLVGCQNWTVRVKDYLNCGSGDALQFCIVYPSGATC